MSTCLYYYYWSNGATCYVCNVLQCILWSVEACGSAIRIIKSTVVYSNAMNTWVPYSILCRYKHLSVVSKYAISYYRLQVSAVCHCLRTVLTKIPPRGARIVKLVGSSISNWWFESCAWRTLGSWAEEWNDLNSANSRTCWLFAYSDVLSGRFFFFFFTEKFYFIKL